MLLYFHTFWPCQLQLGHKFEFYLFALLQDITFMMKVFLLNVKAALTGPSSAQSS